MQKTYQPKRKDIDRKWHLMDAKGQVLGRFASNIAQILIGKHKPAYSPHLDMGDCVVVVNAKEIEVTGRKANQKVYYKHSGFPGGFSETSYKKLLKDNPEKIIEKAVGGMLPRNRLHSPRLRRMKVYAGDKHPYGEKFEKIGNKEIKKQ